MRIPLSPLGQRDGPPGKILALGDSQCPDHGSQAPRPTHLRPPLPHLAPRGALPRRCRRDPLAGRPRPGGRLQARPGDRRAPARSRVPARFHLRPRGARPRRPRSLGRRSRPGHVVLRYPPVPTQPTAHRRRSVKAPLAALGGSAGLDRPPPSAVLLLCADGGSSRLWKEQRWASQARSTAVLRMVRSSQLGPIRGWSSPDCRPAPSVTLRRLISIGATTTGTPGRHADRVLPLPTGRDRHPAVPQPTVSDPATRTVPPAENRDRKAPHPGHPVTSGTTVLYHLSVLASVLLAANPPRRVRGHPAAGWESEESEALSCKPAI